MPYLTLFVIAALIGLIVLALRKKTAYYQKIYSDAHYAEISRWLVDALALGPVSQPSVENRTGFQTSAQIALSFSRKIEGGKDLIHLGVSQVGNITTHAVASRIGFFMVQLLNKNRADADFFFTESGVHHLVFQKQAGGEWVVNDVPSALEQMAQYEPLPFHAEALPEA